VQFFRQPLTVHGLAPHSSGKAAVEQVPRPSQVQTGRNREPTHELSVQTKLEAT
jgi:hypothetical protein